MQPIYRCPHCGGELFYDRNVWVCKTCNISAPPGYPGYGYQPPSQWHPQGTYPYQTYQPYQTNYQNPEIQGLIPNRYDLLFYTGVGIFILLLFAFIRSHNNPIFFIMTVFCIPIPILAIYWDFKNSVRSTSGTLGNICAICWIIIQIIITIIMGFAAIRT